MEQELAGRQIDKSVDIDAAPQLVWDAITDPGLMRQWMSEYALQIIVDWQPGNNITITGDLHGIYFETKGKVLQYAPLRLLEYTHLSSLSELPDVPESYTRLRFELQPLGQGTSFRLLITGFPTSAIFHHLQFYWGVTLQLLKRFVEQGNNR